MASVPTLKTPRTQLERGPVVYQDTGDTRGAFGEQGAQELIDAGRAAGQMANFADEQVQASVRIQEREDAIARVRDLRKLNNEASARFGELTNAAAGNEEGDETSLEQRLTSYRQELGSMRDRALGQHQPALASSRAAFAKQAEDLIGKHDANAITFGLNASKAAVERESSQYIGDQAEIVASNPAAWEDARSNVEEFLLLNYDKTVTPQEAQAMRETAADMLGEPAVRSHLNAGDLEGAARTLETVGVEMSNGTKRKLRTAIYAQEGAIARKTAETKANMDLIKSTVDWDSLSKDQQTRIAVAVTAGINLPANAKTLADEIKALDGVMKTVRGSGLTEAEISNRYKLSEKPDKPIGGLRGHQFNLLTDMSDDFEHGLTSREDTQAYVNTAATFVREYRDPDTGLLTRSALPLSAARALRAQGFDPAKLEGAEAETALSAMEKRGQSFSLDTSGTLDFSGTESGQTTLPQAPADGAQATPAQEQVSAALTEANPDLEKSRMATETLVPEEVEADPLPALQEFAKTSKGSRSLFQMAGSLTGPVARIGGAAEGNIITADILGSPSSYAAQRYMRNFKVVLVEAAHRTKRFADADRKYLTDEVYKDITPALLGNPQALQLEFISIDELFRDEMAHIDVELQNPEQLSKERREELRDRKSMFRFVLDILGVERASTDEELFSLIRSGKVKAGMYIAVPDEDSPDPENPTFVPRRVTAAAVSQVKAAGATDGNK